MLKDFFHFAAKGMEFLGVASILVGVFYALWKFFQEKRSHEEHTFQLFRRHLGRAILLGLEFLIAADIIATVIGKPDMQRVLVLGVVVIIRTFLSLSITMEIEGKVPWKQNS